MPRGKVFPRYKDKKSVRAVKEKLALSNQYKSDPYVVPIDVQEDLPKTIAAIVGECHGKEDGRLNLFFEKSALTIRV